MKQEQVIELAKQANIDVRSGDSRIRVALPGASITSKLARFASLVEQATLERAAHECGAHLYARNAAIALRNLAKDTQ